MTETAPVLARVEGRIGRLTLNRPKAMNALDLDMIRIMTRALLDWREDPDVVAVLVDSAGGKAFCAGGDVRALVEPENRTGDYARNFYEEEYRLNTLIKEYPKPYIALIDGIVMGGGVGISVHGTRRICGGRALFAMPETGIGFYPDVGGSYFLPRLEGEMGTWLALTGARLKVADMMALGLATDYLPSDTHAKFVLELVTVARSAEDVAQIIDDYADDPGPRATGVHAELIRKCFSADTVEDIIERLEDSEDWAKDQAAILLRKSPTSLKVTLRQMRLGQDMAFRDCMRMELGLSLKFVAGHDFPEGVRALLIERDNDPHWWPNSLFAITEEMVEGYFAPLPESEALTFIDEAC